MTPAPTALSVVKPDAPRGLSIQSWDELQARADYFSKSQLIPVALRGKPADVAIILQMGWELGIDPMQSLNGIEVIQGKPCVKPEMALALIRSRVPGALIQIKSEGEKCTVLMARSKEDAADAYQTTWDKARAQALGLMDKPNYKSQLATMLKWRAVGDAARTVFPDITKGLYIAEEMEGTPQYGPDPGAQAKVEDLNAKLDAAKDVPAEVAPRVLTPRQQNEEAALAHMGLPAQSAAIVTPKSPEPDLPIETESKDSRPNAYWVPKVGPTREKMLKQVDDALLKGVVAKIRAHYDGKEWHPDYLEFVTKAEEYLGLTKPAAPTAPEEPGFDGFDGGGPLS